MKRKVGKTLKRFLYTCTSIVLMTSVCLAANLTLNGANSQTIQNQSFDKLVLTNCTDITIRGCSFASGSGTVVSIAGNCRRITIDSCDIDGKSAACAGIDMGGSYITVRKCRIHDIADDGIQCAGGGDHWYFYENEICHLLGCGTDGECDPCYNGHSDGFEMGFVDTVELKRNLVYDVRSTSAFFMANWTGEVTIRNLLLENNIFYTPECGVVMYVFYVDGIRMYNNTFWKSDWLGVAVGPNTSRLEAYNNIFQCIDYTFMGGTSTGHIWDYNLVGFTGRGLTAQAHDVVNADPKFRRIPTAKDNTEAHLYREVTAADFELMTGSPAIGKGTSGGSIPTTDFYGRPRTVPYDMGAIAFKTAAVIQNEDRFKSSAVQAHGLYPDGQNSVLFDLYGRRMQQPITGGCYLMRSKW